MESQLQNDQKHKQYNQSLTEFEQMKNDMLDQEYKVILDINGELNCEKDRLRNELDEIYAELAEYREETDALIKEKEKMKRE